jgi:hypothetical protein
MFDIELKPVGNTFDITLSAVPPAGSAIITLTGQNLFSMTPNSTQGSLAIIGQ